MSQGLACLLSSCRDILKVLASLGLRCPTKTLQSTFGRICPNYIGWLVSEKTKRLHCKGGIYVRMLVTSFGCVTYFSFYFCGFFCQILQKVTELRIVKLWHCVVSHQLSLVYQIYYFAMGVNFWHKCKFAKRCNCFMLHCSSSCYLLGQN